MKRDFQSKSRSLPVALGIMVTVVLLAVLMAGEASAQIRPAYVANVDEPGRAPYQASVRQYCYLSDPQCDFTFPAVPTGKRLVVQHASGYFSSRQTAATQFIFVSVRRGGNDDLFLPTSFQGSVTGTNSIFVFNQEIREFYTAGETPVVRIATGDRGYPILGSLASALPGTNNVTLSGYLVDCVGAACQAIVP